MADPFVTDRQALFPGQPQADLFRAPVLAQQIPDQFPVLSSKPRFSLVRSSAGSQLARLPGPISSKTSVATQLAADRGLVDARNMGCPSLVKSCFHQRVNLASLYLGKLCCVSSMLLHSCRKEKVGCYRSLPFISGDKWHLGV